MLHISALTVCVGFDDLLSYTIPRNLPKLDSWTILTDHDDSKTINLCKKYSLNCIPTNDFYRNDCVFAKGNAINSNYFSFEKHDLVLMLDADIILFDNFRDVIEDNRPRKDEIIGCYRRGCQEQKDYNPHLPITDYPKISTSLHTPIGFFQLYKHDPTAWHGYPKISGDCSMDDCSFANKFKFNRMLEQEVLHLGVEGKNWQGRREPRWD